jgi:hypothetical protein
MAVDVRNSVMATGAPAETHSEHLLDASLITAQNYWAFGLSPLSGVLGSRNMTFQKLDLFPSSGEDGQKIPAQLGPSERVNLNHWTTPVRVTQLLSSDSF